MSPADESILPKLATVARKRCVRCGETKDVSEFYRCKARLDGLSGYCKFCNHTAKRNWVKANPKRMAELKKRSNDPRKARERVRRYLKRHPEKARAYKRVKKALERGKLVKPTGCEDCGQEVNDRYELHAHHEDYSRPLDVEWLCRKCHRQRHEG